LNIGIIGSGYVGLVTGACFSHLGHRVICIDNNTAKLAALRKGKSPIYEPGLEQLIREGMRLKRLSFSGDIKIAVRECEVLFICVNTPPKENGDADLSYVENVSREIADNLKEYRLIVEKSTVPVQTGEWVEKTMLQHQPRKSLFDVASNPEFLREGSAVHDFLHPDRVVLGVSSKKAEKILRELYAPLRAKMVITDLKSAEIIKHASNSFLAAKISFINAVSRICEAAGADVEQVAYGIGLDPRIGPSFLKAGIGFGGFCFPKDLMAFHHMAEKLGVHFGFLKEVIDINDEQKSYFVQKIEKTLWNLKGKTIGVLGLSFKPDTDDIRYAPSLDIIKTLRGEGAKVRVYDPEAMANTRMIFSDITYCRSAYEAVRNTDAVLFLTEWNEFQQLDFKKIRKLVKHPVIFDGRNMLDPDALKKLGYRYYGIGRTASSL
jgi:UDPglucose 6-dehydrogenase